MQKNKEEAAEYVKLLTKKTKRAKKKKKKKKPCQEQIAKRRRLSSLKVSTSESESSPKGDVLRVGVTNK